ncbi:hypothetical protein ACMT4L_06865 [Deinococcus sp. A31D244]|uniref:hypothetical protein n=1 Tax=Deinococcus sp. A31D244 TaxID=3397675 RepID=UPI0039E14758
MILTAALFIAACLLTAAFLYRAAPILTNCEVCGEPTTHVICRPCERVQGTHDRRGHGTHVHAGRLVRALDARAAVRGDDGYVKGRPS